MRIYLAFFQTQASGPATANYGFWSHTLRAGLEEAGHTVLESAEIAWAEGMNLTDGRQLAAWKDRSWSRALADLAGFQQGGGVDLFLGYFFPKLIEPSAVAEVRRLGIPSVNFFCDNVREFRHVPAEFRAFDLHWVPEWEATRLYEGARLPFVHAPMPVWVPPAARDAIVDEKPGAYFLGSWDPLRAELFSDVAAAGGGLHIHGHGWLAEPGGVAPSPQPARDLATRLRGQWDFTAQHGLSAWMRRTFGERPPAPPPVPASWVGPALSRDDYLRLTRSAEVVIGVNRYASPRLKPGERATYSRLRDIEAPMVGACYLTEWAPGLDQLYDLEREIATYRTGPELVEQAARLRREPARRHTMRAAARRRASADHTIGRSIEAIARRLSLGQPAAPSRT